MAGIDKIYGTTEQARILHKWIKRHRPKAMRYLVPIYDNHGCDVVLANFPRSVDLWLARKCSLDFVLKRLGEQYRTRKAGVIARQRLSKC